MRQRPPKKNIYLRLIVAVALLVLLAVAVVAAVKKIPALLSELSLMPNQKQEDFHPYFTLDEDTVSVVLEDQRLAHTVPPLLENGELYLPASMVTEYMDPFLFWDAYAEILMVTTDTEVMKFSPGALTYTLNDERRRLDIPLRVWEGEAFLPIGLVSLLYPFEITYQPAYNMAVITHRYEQVAVGTAHLQKKADIRYRPEWSSVIEVKAEKDTRLTVYGTEGEFTRVRTEEGLLGYVPTDLLSEPSPLVLDNPPPAVPKTSLWPAQQKVSMMWEAVYHPDANALHMQTPLPAGINVITPTWFSFNEESFSLQSLGSQEYVAWAHEQGVQVWAMLPDDNRTISQAVLTDAAARKRTIDDLMRYAADYGLDGINIDFEHVRPEDGPYYIAFLRELAPAARKNGLILSVDVYVPASGTPYYRRDLVAQTVDFVCVMTYDENVRSSPVSGPVASLPFVLQGVEDMLLEVPKEQLLMGLPFYNRIWRELVNNDTPETRKVQHFGMERTKSFLAEQEVSLDWDDEIGAYYGDFIVVEDGETVMYRVWMEEERSIAEKLKIFKSKDLAGVAGWHRGFENEAVWALLTEVIG